MTRPIPSYSLAARNLRSRLESRIEAGELELPLLPDVSAQVLGACQDEAADRREVAELIHRDPSLAGHVLRVANSAAYAPGVPIVSLQQAVSRLGFGALCGMAISAAVQSGLFRVSGHERTLERLWQHSAIAAAWAKEIARMRRKNVEAAFLCGLLHDIGKPVVLQALRSLIELTGFELADELYDAWVDEFHPAVGAGLLDKWQLPSWMVEAVAYHHEPEQAEQHADEARTACLADLLAHWSLADDDEAAIEGLRNQPVLRSLGMYVDELDELLARKSEVLELAKVLI